MTKLDTHKKIDWPAAYACQVLKFSLYLAGSLTVTPLQRIFEANICRNYYRQHDARVIDSNDNVPEALCKIAPVQEIVSDINGIASGLSIPPALLAALIYLAIHRRWSKKFVLMQNLTGFLLMNLFYSGVLYFYNVFDVRWTYLTSIFNFLGGGFPIFNSIVPALIAESIPQSSLSTFQLYTYAISLLVRIAGTSAGLYMMKANSIWLPVALGNLVHAATIPIVLFSFRGPVFPTRVGISSLISRPGEYSHVPLNEEDLELSSNASEPDLARRLPDRQPPLALIASIRAYVGQISPTLVHCLLPIAVYTFRDFGDSVRFFLPYWMSRRYNWELREVGWVQLADTLFSALVVSVLPLFAKTFLQQTDASKPAPAYVMTTIAPEPAPSLNDLEGNSNNHDKDEPDSDSPNESRHTLPVTGSYPTTRRDLALAKFCLLFSLVGTFLLGLSWYRLSAFVSLAVMTGGVGFQEAYFSYLAGYMSEQGVTDLSSVYMVLSMVALISMSLGSWAVSGIYSVALELGGDSWETSAPVWFCTGAFGITYLILRRHL